VNQNEYVLHLDLIALAPDVTPEAREALIASAGELGALANVERVGVIEADAPDDFDVAFFFVLRGFASLEPFGTDPTYAAFLPTKVAPLLRGLAGADVRLEKDLPPMSAYGACLGLAAPPTTYDWELSANLTAWLQRYGLDGTVGLAIGEHGRFRGLAIAFSDAALDVEAPVQKPFGPSLIKGRARALP
jgi:hypothetical protein